MQTKLIFISLILFAFAPSQSTRGQAKFKIDLLGGPNYNWVRNEVLQGERPAFGWCFGGGATITPHRWKRFSIGINTLIFQKGYEQTLGQEYAIDFYYKSIQVITNYSFHPSVSATVGVDFSSLTDATVEEGLSTYNHFDFGLISGINFFIDKPLGINVRLIYGLTPMLDYYKIDALGNFNGMIKDLKNTCLTVELKYRLAQW